MLTRRRFLHSSLALSSLAVLKQSSAQLRTATRLRIPLGRGITAVPRDFAGLGYELSSAARPDLFSTGNQRHVQLIRNLGHAGMLRLGGIVADFTSYADQGKSKTDPKDTVITPADLQRLSGFLNAIGWKAIWSVNFGRGTLQQALIEVRAVNEHLGDRLLALELGNEVENYGNGTDPARHPPYTFTAFRAEYDRWRSAILAAHPGISFAAPDTAASVDWVEQMAVSAHGAVQLLTTHYYRGGQKQATLDQLLSPDPALVLKLQRLRHASITSGIPWRMCETNSFFGGGHPGLSDTFAGTLWTLDFMLLLAQSGCAGVNIETGFNQLGFLSSYSPILNDEAGQCTIGASYYGMLAFAISGAPNHGIFALEADHAPQAASFYAIGSPSNMQCVILINKTLDQPMHISTAGLPLRKLYGIRLTAPSPQSKDEISLGGSAVDSDGKWMPHDREEVAGEMLLPACSAILLQSRS